MEYKKHYNLLILKAQSRIERPTVTERHHILPKSMGGSEKTDNIVHLTPKEHFVAHHLLWKIHRNKKMFYAYWCMITKLGRSESLYRVTSRVYDTAKRIHKLISSETHRGKTPWNKGRINIYSPETIEKMKKSAREKPEDSLETRKRKSESAKSRPMAKNLHSKESREKRQKSINAWINNNRITCLHCNKSGVKSNMERYHFSNCLIINPEAIRKSKSKGKVLARYKCPHCNIEASGGNLRRWHLDNCKENRNVC